MLSVLAYAKKPVGVVMMRSLLRHLVQDPRIYVRGTARQFGHAFANTMFRAGGVGGVHSYPKWLARLRAFDLYLSSDFGVIAPRSRYRVHVFHGVSFRNHAVNEGALRYDMLMLAGPYMREQFKKMGLINVENAHRFPVIGMPKLDDLVNGVYSQESELKSRQLDPSLPTVLYAPTWSSRVSSLEQYGESLVHELVRSGKNVIVKLHDNSLDRRKAGRDWRSFMRSIKADNFHFDEGFDVVPTMVASDVLISDASSVANEYALLDRPILFMDLPNLKGNLKQKADLETWGRKAGDLVEGPLLVNDAIDRALADPGRYSDIRRALVADLFYKPGTASSRAIDAIYGLLKIPLEQ